MEWINGVTIGVVLFVIGLLTLMLRRDLIVKLLGLGLLNTSVILVLISLGYYTRGVAPIITGKPEQIYIDPLPQALVLSAIVINLAILALSLVFVMILMERYHTTDSVKIAQQIEYERSQEQAHIR
ncbi:cation:proton antiporter subunit C [Candidatus Acetothermia bacterium]|jgi:multicomponent Na+:H+ antiporter subunit C|nr:cation:proton antiporter subunit C [Candidatus Acetothermia bacterium]MCI2427635.1 cation:proton antiporter subunit C [Candidatus Acetothermia bacterium]MCI2428484.1 cation:proton antiporter subunit C [Candidatus Acetothermia bacterium]